MGSKNDKIIYFFREEVEALANKLGHKFFKTSVKKDQNVKEIFEFLAQSYVESMKMLQEEDKTDGTPNTGELTQGPIVLTKKPQATTPTKKPFCTVL